MADTLALGASDRKIVEVQLLSRAQIYMKKYLLPIFIFLFSASGVLAQSEDLYTKFLRAGYPYRDALQRYTQSRAQHLQYGSTTTRQELITQTKDLLIKRNSLQIAYLEDLRSELGRVTNVSEYNNTVNYLNLEKEIVELKSFFSNLDSKNSFKELQDRIDVWNRFVEKEAGLIYSTRLQIATAKLIALQDQTRILLSDFATESSVINLINDKLYTSRTILNVNEVETIKTSKKILYEALLLLDDLYKRK